MRSTPTCPPIRFILSTQCTMKTHTGCQRTSMCRGQLFYCACDCHRSKQLELALKEVPHGPAVPESLGNTGTVG
jgi:hypothetical protein